ncbi:hypothetical protein OG429_31430 [Streptomyces sp. NBC_00190]|uniref:hypothetical protein n=1 Tax=unclassified Streptomyces TaxID=2593676 RepID=UPI002E2A0FCE|nr:hypothetical protein [Streptomyces sp. NBC_00190]WSZ43403.1 hypothetical protein OG239_34000 [Streptomyces sp. NBC_00868]
MRISALSAALAVTAMTLAGSVTPATAEPTVSTVTLDAGAGLHHSTGTVLYEHVDGEVNSIKIISAQATGGTHDCAWVQWNDPKAGGDGWSPLISEPGCYGSTVGETPNIVIKAPAGHPLKVRLAAYHFDSAEVKHKDIAKL